MTAGRPTSVLLVTMDFPPTRGGIQTMAREICRRASRTSLTVLAPSHPRSATFDGTLNARVRRVRAPGGVKGLVPAMAFAARREARHHDVVLALHVLAAPGSILARAPTVVFNHGGELRSGRIRRVARWVLPRASHVVSNSRYSRTASVALGADPMRSSVALVGAPDPVAVPPERIEALRAEAGGPYVLCVARLEPHKGVDRVIEALPHGARLVVVGDGPERPALEAQARARGASVLFKGFVDEEALPAMYAAAEAFAGLSRATQGARAGVEGGGIALLEACAYGLPVLAGATGGIPETIRDNDTGLLVDPEDPAAIARALRRLLDDRALARRLGDAARAMATGERSWAHFVERIEDVLEAAARPRAEARG